jgi:hypothetical protein
LQDDNHKFKAVVYGGDRSIPILLAICEASLLSSPFRPKDVSLRLKVTKLKHGCRKFVNRICHIRCPRNAWLFLFAGSFAADDHSKYLGYLGRHFPFGGTERLVAAEVPRAQRT